MCSVEDEREEMVAWFEEHGLEAHAAGAENDDEVVIVEADDWVPEGSN